MKLVIRGIVKDTSSWINLGEVESDETATTEELNEAAEDVREIISHAFKSGTNGYLNVDTAVINIQAFAIITVEVK
jgi:hypothetical protein